MELLDAACSDLMAKCSALENPAELSIIRRKLDRLVTELKRAPRSSAVRSALLQSTHAWKELTKRYGELRIGDIIAFTQFVNAIYPTVPLPVRDDKRNFARLVSFVEKYWEEFRPWLDRVEFLDENGRPIIGETADS
jgi:hypothetical protein